MFVAGADIQVDGEDEAEFELTSTGAGNEDDDHFDQVVGCLQEIILDADFERMQKNFSTEHCMQFEATEENKLVYTTIFNQYQDSIERYINEKLEESIEGFSMERFIALL